MLVTRNRRVAITMMSFSIYREKEMQEDNTVVNAQRVIDIMSHIDKSLKSVVVDSKDSSLSFLWSLKSCFDMMKSPEDQIRLARYICSVLESSDSCIPVPVPPAFGSTNPHPCSPYPSPPHDERKEKEVTNLLHEIHQTHKALSHLRLFQDVRLFQDDVKPFFFDNWRESSDAEKEVIAKKIVHVTKQKKRKRDEEEAKRQEREAKEAIDLKWLLKACDSGEKASELLSLMSLDPTVTESLIQKFCIAVVKSGKCDRVVVDRVVIDKYKSNPF